MLINLWMLSSVHKAAFLQDFCRVKKSDIIKFKDNLLFVFILSIILVPFSYSEWTSKCNWTKYFENVSLYIPWSLWERNHFAKLETGEVLWSWNLVRAKAKTAWGLNVCFDAFNCGPFFCSWGGQKRINFWKHYEKRLSHIWSKLE